MSKQYLPKYYNNTPTHKQSIYHNKHTPNPQYAMNDIRQLPTSNTPHQYTHKRIKQRYNRSTEYQSPSKSSEDRCNRSYSNNHTDSHSPSQSNISSTSDSDGIIDISVGDTINNRYIISGYAGSGTFGTVYECIDTTVPSTSTQYKCAIKIIRSIPRYSDAAYIEADILQQLNRCDTDNHYTSQCVTLYNIVKFTHHAHKHVALVFELLGQSLYSFLKHNNYQPYNRYYIKRFAYQIIKSIQFCHRNKLIHTDLKLENILLYNSDYIVENNIYRIPVSYELRLIDFGGSIYESQYHSQMIQTRQYRAPEVVLNIGWSYPADIWSIGCILAECATGNLLYATHNDIEHIQLIEKVTSSKIPQYMIASALSKYSQHNKYNVALPYTSTDILIKQWNYNSTVHTNINTSNQHTYNHTKDSGPPSHQSRSPSTAQLDQIFDIRTGTQYWPNNALSQSSVLHVSQQPTLVELFMNYDIQFYSLMCGLLQIDPLKRLTAAHALQHEYFDEVRTEMNLFEQKLIQQRNQLHVQYVPIHRPQSINNSNGSMNSTSSSNDRQHSHSRHSDAHYHSSSHNNTNTQIHSNSIEYNTNDIRLKRYRSRHFSRYYQRYTDNDYKRHHRYNAKHSSHDHRSSSPSYTTQSHRYARNDVRNTPVPHGIRYGAGSYK